MIESLEGRRLASSAVRHSHPGFTIANDTLSISGSFRDDAITLSIGRKPLQLSLNGKVYRVPKSVTRFFIYGGAGDDHITSSLGGRRYVYIDGGTGNDVLQAGSDRDTLLGDTGDDRLTGIDSDPNNYIYMDAGPGDDQLFYGNTMYGGRGYDTAEFAVTEFKDNIISGGIERYEDHGIRHSSTLSSRNGNLLFTYLTDGFQDQSISGPMLRADGVVQINVVLDADNPATPPADTPWRVQFDARYTALAKSRGLVFTYSGPQFAAGEYGQTVLLGTP